MKQLYLCLAATLISMSAMADEWRPLGNAVVMDGWITPGYVDDDGNQMDPQEYAFEVPIEESVENPGMYKLINPFGGSDFMLSEFNLDGNTPSDIVIDARDRTFVIIQPQYCGFTDADADEASGQYKYYISDMGTYMYNLGQQREVINILKCASTMSGNIISIPQPTFGTTADHAIQAWDPSYPAAIILPDETITSDENWETVGTATITDGWMMPGWTDNDDKTYVVADHPFTCDLQMNTENPNIIGLVDPFSSDDYELSCYNLSASHVRIVLDITDPDFVTLEPQFSGFIARKDNDIMSFYINEAGNYMLSKGYTREAIIERGNNSTLKDGLITISTPLFGFAIDDAGKIWNSPQAATIRIESDGVSSAIVDQDNTPAEYYNLQGVKISNPSKGMLYIKRQGDKASKIIF
jgi:hypothetical protein